MSKIKELYTILHIKSYIDELFSKKADVSDAQKAFRKIKATIGTNEQLDIEFKGTNNLDECKSLVEAIIKLDSLLPKK